MLTIRTYLSTLSIALALALVMGVGGVNIALAQTTQASLTTKFSEGASVQAGQPLVIPFYLNTHGISVDGVQVSGRFAGVPLSEVRMEMGGELKAQSLSQEITNEGFTIMISSADPSLPVVTNEDVLVFELTVVPAQAGEFKIEYDSENTLVPSSADSTNILAAPSPVSVAVGGESSAGGVTQPASLVNALLALAVAGALVAAGVFYMRKQEKKPTSSTSSTPPTSQV